MLANIVQSEKARERRWVAMVILEGLLPRSSPQTRKMQPHHSKPAFARPEASIARLHRPGFSIFTNLPMNVWCLILHIQTQERLLSARAWPPGSRHLTLHVASSHPNLSKNEERQKRLLCNTTTNNNNGKVCRWPQRPNSIHRKGGLRSRSHGARLWNSRCTMELPLRWRSGLRSCYNFHDCAHAADV